MELSPEVIMLTIYAVSITMIILGVAIGFSRLHQKLNKILFLLAHRNKYNSSHICDNKDDRQNKFPNSHYVAKPNKTSQENPN